jgi:POT family proton-dependent oligopeptide transporter
MSVEAVAASRGPREWLGHPRALRTLFFTEMWERFSYYGMRALLILFMVDQIESGGLALSDQTATAIYGLYISAVYLVCLPGGWVADRLWGAQRAVWVGGILIMCGHFVLAIPGIASFFIGLLLVVSGTGLLKPNISACVGELYAPGDPRRDSGFSIYYMGINLGAWAGALVCGWLAQGNWRFAIDALGVGIDAQANWHFGFAAAGVGMLLGLLQFRVWRADLGAAGGAPASAASPSTRATARAVTLIVFAIVGALLWMGLSGTLSIDAPSLARWTTGAIVVATILYFAYVFATGRLTPTERNRIIVIIALVLACAMFWAGFEQTGSSLNLFAERYTIREFGGFEIPASWFQSLNPTFIILLAPFYSMLWLRLARRHLDPSAPAKFALGLIILGLGFAVMMGAAVIVASGQQVLPTWLIFTYLLHTMGELALSPVGLSAMTKLAPRRFAGQMMGMWFMGTALGNIIAGLIAGEFDPNALGDMPGLYLQIVLTTVGSGLILLLCVKPLKRLSGGVQ